MPMSEHLPTFRIADNLAQVRLWELVEARLTLRVECVSCSRRASWPPELLRQRLKKNLANRLVQVAGRFRCGACRSPYVLIGREPPAQPAPADGREDPAGKRGFTDRNLDPNARARPAWPRR